MNRQETKNILPIIQAFAEGKTVQFKWGNGAWVDLEKNDALNLARLVKYPQDYRIKPEPKYRPFKNKEECWQEMQKHQPLGWIKASHGQFLIIGIRKNGVAFGVNDNWHGYNYIFNDYTFADGTPFGIKEE